MLGSGQTAFYCFGLGPNNNWRCIIDFIYQNISLKYNIGKTKRWARYFAPYFGQNIGKICSIILLHILPMAALTVFTFENLSKNDYNHRGVHNVNEEVCTTSMRVWECSFNLE